MAFKGEDAGVSKHVAIICTCKQMASRAASINSRSASKMTYAGNTQLHQKQLDLCIASSVKLGCAAEFVQHTQPCWHASAAKDLLTEEAVWLESLPDADLYDRVSQVKFSQSTMSIIHCDSHDVAGLALSVAMHDNGFPRCTVGADTDDNICCHNSQCCSKMRKYSCEHCRLIADELQHIQSQLDNEDVASADIEEATAMLTCIAYAAISVSAHESSVSHEQCIGLLHGTMLCATTLLLCKTDVFGNKATQHCVMHSVDVYQ